MSSTSCGPFLSLSQILYFLDKISSLKTSGSKIQAVAMSYLRGGCGVNRMDGESNENVYRKFGMSSTEEKE